MGDAESQVGVLQLRCRRVYNGDERVIVMSDSFSLFDLSKCIAHLFQLSQMAYKIHKNEGFMLAGTHYQLPGLRTPTPWMQFKRRELSKIFTSR